MLKNFNEFCESYEEILGKLWRKFKKVSVKFQDITILGKILRKLRANFGEILEKEWIFFLINHFSSDTKNFVKIKKSFWQNSSNYEVITKNFQKSSANFGEISEKF